GAEPWRVPQVEDLPRIEVRHADRPNGIRGDLPGFLPYLRDERLVRPWAIPGTPGLEHRLGGLEKEPITGHVSYAPEDHEAMVRQRADRIAGIATDIPELTVDGPAGGELLVVGWGSTHGAIADAALRCRRRGLSVAHAHLRYLNPLPRNTGELL